MRRGTVYIVRADEVIDSRPVPPTCPSNLLFALIWRHRWRPFSTTLKVDFSVVVAEHVLQHRSFGQPGGQPENSRFHQRDIALRKRSPLGQGARALEPPSLPGKRAPSSRI